METLRTVKLVKHSARTRLGQVSIEYLLVVSFTVLLLFPMLYLFYSQSGSFEGEVIATQTEKIAQRIVDSADSVYYLGEPSQQRLTVIFPSNIKSVAISGNSVVFLVNGNPSDYEVVKWSVANLTGNISRSEGIHHITLAARQTGVIIVE